MELKGKWACPEFYDSQINITEDGRVSCEFAEIGEYGVTPEFTIDGDKIKLSACGLEFDLKREGDKLILTGKSVGNGINIAFTDTLTIDRKSTDDSLFLRQETNVQAFGRLRR